MSENILNQTRNPFDVSQKKGIALTKAKALIKDCEEELPGWGPLSKQPHIISRRHVALGWPPEHREHIHYHQKLHDQGRVNLCQGRDGSFFILYAMPNKTPVQRAPWFFTDRGY